MRPISICGPCRAAGLEPGETAEQCAAREMREELGLWSLGPAPVMVQSLKSAKGEWRLAVFATQAFAGEIAALRRNQRPPLGAA